MIKTLYRSINVEVRCSIGGNSNLHTIRWGRLNINTWRRNGQAYAIMWPVSEFTFKQVCPDGLPVAVERWLYDWGYAGMKLNTYLFKMFGPGRKYNGQ